VRLLQTGLFVVLLLPGIDEVQYFFSRKWFITDWNDYLAPIFPRLVGLDRDTIMLIAGAIEIVVALVLLARPRLGGLLACIGLWLIVVNLLIHSAYDIVIRDFGLSLAALAIWRTGSRSRSSSARP
jgi:hypothetical protein